MQKLIVEQMNYEKIKLELNLSNLSYVIILLILLAENKGNITEKRSEIYELFDELTGIDLRSYGREELQNLIDGIEIFRNNLVQASIYGSDINTILETLKKTEIDETTKEFIFNLFSLYLRKNLVEKLREKVIELINHKKLKVYKEVCEEE